MFTASLAWVQKWKFLLGESISRWLDFDPARELGPTSFVEILLSRHGYKLASPSRSAVSGCKNPAELDLHERQEVVVSVHTSMCYCRISEIPVVAPAIAGQILSLERESIMPASGADCLSGHYVVERHADTGIMRVEQIVLRRDLLKPLVEYCKDRDIAVRAVTFHDEGERRLPIAIELDGTPYASARFRRWVQAAAASYAGLLLAGAVTIAAVSWQASAARDRIAGESAAIRENVSAIQGRLDQLKSSSAETADLVTWKRQSAAVLAVMEELSQILPDSAFAESLVIDGANIQIEGQALSPEQLVGVLETSLMFEGVAFSSPVYRNPNDGYSRYALRMKIASQAEDAAP